MLMNPGKTFSHLALCLFAGLLFFLPAGCRNENQPALQDRLAAADSLYFMHKPEEAATLLNRVRPLLTNPESLQMATYYLQQARICSSAECRFRYADSALSFFTDPQKRGKYPAEYAQALLLNGDIRLYTGSYNAALQFYAMTKAVDKKGQYTSSNLLANIGSIYFNQREYHKAAITLLESYKALLASDERLSPERYFFHRQGALNNIGVAYERAGFTDSALVFYRMNLDLIDHFPDKKQLDTASITEIRLVAYDNIGGLFTTTGQLDSAEYYLTKALALPFIDHSSQRAPTFLKLARLYQRSGRYQEARQQLAHAHRLLLAFPTTDRKAELNYYRLSAAIYEKAGQLSPAFRDLQAYADLEDSLRDHPPPRMDVEKEFEAYTYRQDLLTARHQRTIGRMYVAGSSILLLLLGIWLAMGYRNLRRTKALHRQADENNLHLQQTLSELEKANLNYVKIMRVMAHDLRNPLLGIGGLTDLLRSGAYPPEEQDGLLSLIGKTSGNAITMIESILSSGWDHRQVVDKAPCDVRQLLLDCVELLRFRAAEKKQQLLFQATGERFEALLNAESIQRVFNNLIVNAIKFSYEGTSIRTGIKQQPNSLQIYIEDQGIGISPKEAGKVFEMFSAARKPGTSGEPAFGLGLYICKNIVEQHQGRLWFESTEGKGSCFYVELPISV
jgi:signal transduction histidine kinase